MPLTPSPNPAFSNSLPALTTSSVAHPDTWNPIHQQLLDNTVALKESVVQNKAAADQATQDLDRRLDGVEATSSVSVQRAVALDWLYRNNAINFEMFVKGYTLIDLEPVAVVQGVSGDDSLDLVDTSALRAGEFYVLNDRADKSSALVRIQTVLSDSRIRLSANLSRNWGGTATLCRCSFDVQGALRAMAEPGAIYLSRSINIGTDQAGGAVVMRRTQNAGAARLYFRDAYQLSWRECGWSLRRDGGDVPNGYADYEYILPMRGDGWLRIDVEGEAITIAHIVALGQATGLGGFINPILRPNAPVLVTPSLNATGVMERPTFAFGGYSSPAASAQQALNIQLSRTADFAAVMHDSGVLPAGLSYALPAAVLVAGATYYARGRVQDVAGLWSDWSPVSSFTTASSFAYVVAPTVTGPLNNATDIGEQPTYSTSAFSVAGATDVHIASQWRVRAANGTQIWDSGQDATNRLSVVQPAGRLKPGQNYYVQARHLGADRGWSEWSSEVKITTRQSFGNVIGIVQVDATTWARIDESGNTKVTDASFFSSHAVYGGVQDQLIDGQYMVRIPAFYVKRGVIAAGTYQGKAASWISDVAMSGYELHPAFKLAGANISQFWVGKYQASFSSGKAESKPNAVPYINSSAPNWRAASNNRNVSGVTGFGLWNIYQLSAIQLLTMIEVGGPDVQALVGRGNVKGRTSGIAVTDHPLNIEASWRGIVGLWGNVWQFVEGVEVTSSNVYLLWDRQGNKEFRSTGKVAPPLGTISAMIEGTGDGFDLRDVFLPATTGSTAATGSAFGGDIFYSNNTASEAFFGGSYNDSLDTYAGLFALGLSWGKGSSTGVLACRLSKV